VKALANVLNIDIDYIRKNNVTGDKNIQRIGICTGSGQNYFKPDNQDIYITGESGLPQMIQAKENNAGFLAAGHHNTERYGIQALGENLSNDLNIEHQFIEITIDA
jgi:putative NIF3 family GTP cyclohydrolase 1 type 2